MDKNKTLAQDVLQKIGGKENIISVFHCATRLRFELQDQTKVNEEELNKIRNGQFLLNKNIRHGDFVILIYNENVEKICAVGIADNDKIRVKKVFL